MFEFPGSRAKELSVCLNIGYPQIQRFIIMVYCDMSISNDQSGGFRFLDKTIFLVTTFTIHVNVKNGQCLEELDRWGAHVKSKRQNILLAWLERCELGSHFTSYYVCLCFDVYFELRACGPCQNVQETELQAMARRDSERAENCGGQPCQKREQRTCGPVSSFLTWCLHFFKKGFDLNCRLSIGEIWTWSCHH